MNEINTPRVSVILNTYNRSGLLKEAIESVRKQTFQNWELIVIDDGSSDNTPEVVSEYPKLDARIRYVRHENRGLAASRNRGIELSCGPYVAFLDDDDLWLPEKLYEQVNALDSNPGISLVYVWSWHLDMETGLQKPGPEVRMEHTYRRLYEGNCICSPSQVMMRKECFDKVGLFDPKIRIADDYDVWLRMLSCGLTFRAIEKRLLIYRRHAGCGMKLTELCFRGIIQCLEKAPLVQGVTRDEQRKRLSENYYFLADLHFDNRKWFEAARSYLRALSYLPTVGLRIHWGQSGSIFYRFLRPWLASVYCLMRSVSSRA